VRENSSWRFDLPPPHTNTYKEVYMESNSDHRHEQNGFFEEETIVMPYEEEIRMRAEQILSDNQDALRHFVDVVGWETFDYPEIRKFLIPLLWHWADIDPSWVAEACCMSVRNVCEIAESQPSMTFNCLDCGAELPVRSRQHLLISAQLSKPGSPVALYNRE